MTFTEVKNFYKQNKKKYEINKNKELLKWLNESIKKGYHVFINIEDLQEMIDNIALWYEIKYPEREIESHSGVKYFDFENIKTLSTVMDIEQLMYRLPHNQLCLMKSDYRSNGGGLREIIDESGKTTGYKTVLFMTIKRKEISHNSSIFNHESPNILLHADTNTGLIEINYNLKNIINTKNITLEELLQLLKENYSEQFDYTELEACIFDHNCDIELRRQLLQLVALKLLYSDKTIPERGYERAKKFINECNKEMKLNLNSEEIDEIMNKDYTNGERWERVLKTYKDYNGNPYSYWTVEKIENSPHKNKIFIQSILNKYFKNK